MMKGRQIPQHRVSLHTERESGPGHQRNVGFFFFFLKDSCVFLLQDLVRQKEKKKAKELKSTELNHLKP